MPGNSKSRDDYSMYRDLTTRHSTNRETLNNCVRFEPFSIESFALRSTSSHIESSLEISITHDFGYQLFVSKSNWIMVQSDPMITEITTKPLIPRVVRKSCSQWGKVTVTFSRCSRLRYAIMISIRNKRSPNQPWVGHFRWSIFRSINTENLEITFSAISSWISGVSDALTEQNQGKKTAYLLDRNDDNVTHLRSRCRTFFEHSAGFLDCINR
jgi:hypothetical protein